MFKCTICKKEFETKPDFCDCGNDEFISIEDKKPATAAAPDNTQAKQADITQAKKAEPSFIKKDKGELVSIGIFLLCIILSVLFIVFF